MQGVIAASTPKAGDVNAKPQAQSTNYKKNPYWEPKDWTYISGNSGVN
jgi:hypothetical protein